MRKFISLVESAPDREAERLEAFRKLADAQRGEPETIMLRAQHIMGGGVLSVLVEHIGDLTHRMSEMPDRIPNCGYEFVKPKVLKGLRFLTNEYGFEREHLQNMANNAKFKGITLEEQLARVKKILREYAVAHRKLEVYNGCQAMAREAAVSLGEENWADATRFLELLKGFLVDPKTWTEFASRYEPGYCSTSTGYRRGTTTISEKVERIEKRTGPDALVWRNPRKPEFIAALNDGRYRVGRGIVERGGDIVVWNADHTHQDMCREMGVEYETVQLFVFAEDIDLLEVESDWAQGGVFRFGDIFVFGTGGVIAPLSFALGKGDVIGHLAIKPDGDFGIKLYPN